MKCPYCEQEIIPIKWLSQPIKTCPVCGNVIATCDTQGYWEQTNPDTKETMAKDTVGKALSEIYAQSQWGVEDTEEIKETRLSNIRDTVKYLIDPKLNPELDPFPRYDNVWFEALLKMELPDPD